MIYTRTYNDLHLTCLGVHGPRTTCGYFYAVQHQAMSHTAFRTRAALLQWLALRGLTIKGELPATDAEAGCYRIEGSYREATHGERVTFYDNILRGTFTREMSNGRYTLGLITTDADGIRTVHTLNVNLPRPEFDHAASRALEDAGAIAWNDGEARS